MEDSLRTCPGRQATFSALRMVAWLVKDIERLISKCLTYQKNRPMFSENRKTTRLNKSIWTGQIVNGKETNYLSSTK